MSFKLGSVSVGTLRTEDLLPAFENIFQQLGGTYEDFPVGVTDEEYVENLAQRLNDLCPPFVYFGAHPGDGADFGFWPDMDSLNEAMQTMGMASESDEEILKEDNVIVQVSDHGNVTVMDMERNVLWSIV